MQVLELVAELPVRPEVVWDVLNDHPGWARWGGAQEVVVRQQGEPPPSGLGTTRVLRAHGLAVEEEVTAFEPPRRLAYRVVAGLPLREHRAEIRLAPSPAGTRLVWSVEFRPWLPGTGPLLRWGMQRALQGILARLREELETRRAA